MSPNRLTLLAIAAALTSLSPTVLSAQVELADSAARATRDSLAAIALEDVKFLSADGLRGRLIGTPGADSAAAYIARRFAKAGLQAGPRGWFQDFTVARDAPAASSAGIGGVVGHNVIGVAAGRDPSRRNEIVIVGAHYDHLGLGRFGSLDPDSTGSVHNGADDNASGIAALERIAAQIAASPPARTVVFIAFSGEEEGVLGSTYYTRNPLYPMSAVTSMVNLDMVGRLRNNRLIVYGVETASEFRGILDSLNTIAGFDLKASGDGYGPSDHQSFYLAGKPVLHVFTDLHEDYHRATDDWPKINAVGLERVAEFTASVVRALADRKQPLTFVSAPPPAAHTGDPAAVTPGYGAYLGTIPDMAGGDPRGVRISGVRAGSPAEAAGLKADDVITKIGDLDVPDLQAMTTALRAHKPGDKVEIRIWRGDQSLLLTATLGTRSSS
ncbi:MAG TPA: M28 family peptidase [Gemmatimonadales bacterium]|nr:M28 family peptidase [Gemmatimonadales bacterium]